MTPQADSSEVKREIKREIQATLAARRELGPEYDDQFLNALVEKLSQPGPAQRAQPPRLPQRSNALDAGQRLSLAICSLIFGIPLVAIASGENLAGIIVVCFAILGINFAASR